MRKTQTQEETKKNLNEYTMYNDTWRHFLNFASDKILILRFMCFIIVVIVDPMSYIIECHYCYWEILFLFAIKTIHNSTLKF